MINIAVVLLFSAGPVAVFAFVSRCGDFYTPMLSGSTLGCVLCSLILVCARMVRGGPALKWNSVYSWVAAFCAAAFISAVHTSNATPVYRSATILFTFASASYFLFCALSDDIVPFRPLFVVPAAGVIFSIMALGQFAGFDSLPLKSRYAYDLWLGFHAYAVFGNANLLADFLSICIPVSVGMALAARKRWARVFYIFCTAAMLCCIAITSSRGAILGALAGAAVLMYLLFSRTKKAAAVSGVICILLLIGAISIFKIEGNEYFKQNSMRLRLMTWKAASLMIRDNPVTGVGMGRFGKEYLRYQAEYFRNPANLADAPLANIEKQRHAHNEFVQVAAETGIIGFAAFMGLLISIALRLARCRSGSLSEDAIPVSLLGSLTAFCIVALFSFPLRMPITLALLALLAACAASCSPAGSRTRTLALRLPRFFSIPRVRVEISAIFVMIGFLAFLEFTVEPLISSVFTKIGMAALDSGQTQYAESMCGKALSADRQDGAAAYCLGMSGLASEHPDDAIYFFTRSLRNIDDPMIHYNLASAYAGMNSFEAAEHELLDMQAMVPAFPLARIELARLYANAGRPADSAAKYREAIAVLKAQAVREPGNTAPLLMLAECYYAIRNFSAYRDMLREALKLSPGDQRILDALKTSGELGKQ